jgi:hypothetical protein
VRRWYGRKGWYGRKVVGGAIAAAALAGCGSSQSSLEQHLKQAAAQIDTTAAPRVLQTKLERTLAALTADRPKTGSERTAKRLAIAGVRSWLRGLESLIAFVENDSGNLPVAARDAHRAYHARLVGANLLRRAGERLDIQIGTLGGF